MPFFWGTVTNVVGQPIPGDASGETRLKKRKPAVTPRNSRPSTYEERVILNPDWIV